MGTDHLLYVQGTVLTWAQDGEDLWPWLPLKEADIASAFRPTINWEEEWCEGSP